ncbi:MAG: 2-hydroxymethylglutarate dehydrogenase [Thermosediminibacterales bacterium]|nr:2-hydroxymethylglutarate dehydrogenase [Thermosediminibacterales bacterium]MDK2836271.1 2-hydroxymethylglutarate dehydrogenase [Thermosediminibacterales bacterium]
MKIGFIGLGNMGKPMSTNILKNGYDVTVYDIDKNSVELLVGQGAKAATSPKEVAAASDIILLSLPNPHIVKEVVAGKNGVLEGIKENAIIADLSTVTPKTIIDLVPLVEERGAKILDAPVSGGVPGAKAGKLTIMVGGDEEVFEKCKPVFETIAKNIYYVGQIGSGLKVKLINQYLFASNLASVVEAFALAAKAGVDAKKLVEIISNSSGSSYALKTRYNYISRNNFEPGFQINLMLKDLSLVLSMAEDNDMPLLLGGMVHQLYRLAKRKGFGEKDVCGLLLAMENINEVKFPR